MASHASPPHRSRLVPPGPSVVGLVEIDRPDVAGTAAIVVAFATGDRALALESAQVAHCRGLAGESKKFLNLTRGRHDSGTAML